jgi:hypothetical protein
MQLSSSLAFMVRILKAASLIQRIVAMKFWYTFSGKNVSRQKEKERHPENGCLPLKEN